MKPHQIRYTPTAAESICHLNPAIKRPVRQAIRGLAMDPLRGHPLVLDLAGFRSLRVSRCRVIYRIEDRVVEIHFIGPRKDVYEVFRQLLDQAPEP